MDIRLPNAPPPGLELGLPPWEREGYTPVPDEDREVVDVDKAVEAYHVLRRDIAWLRAEMRQCLTTGNAMRLRELMELFVWGQDLRRAYAKPWHTGQVVDPITPPDAPPPPRPVVRPKLSGRKRVRVVDDSGWEI